MPSAILLRIFQNLQNPSSHWHLSTKYHGISYFNAKLRHYNNNLEAALKATFVDEQQISAEKLIANLAAYIVYAGSSSNHEPKQPTKLPKFY